MSLIELKLTVLEDYIKKNEDRWFSEYVREHWKFDFKEGDIYEKKICAYMSHVWQQDCAIQIKD